MLKHIKKIKRIKKTKHYLCEFKCVCGNVVQKRCDTKAKSCGCKRNKKYVSSHGYFKIQIKGKSVYEHRYLMEQKIGRKLKTKEQIHHLNNNKKDNQIENLMLCKSSKEYNRIGFGWYKDKNGKWYKNCPKCKKKKQIKKDFYKCKKQYFYVCKKCSNKKTI